jgi:hypothetical protein
LDTETTVIGEASAADVDRSARRQIAWKDDRNMYPPKANPNFASTISLLNDLSADLLGLFVVSGHDVLSLSVGKFGTPPEPLAENPSKC